MAASDKRNGDSSNRCCSCRLLDLTSALARCDLVMSLHQMTPNGSDQLLAAYGLNITHDDARESIASCGSPLTAADTNS
ncbi:MAG: hypothetical protein WCJ18_00445 [Planctomycetota bacterium]